MDTYEKERKERKKNNRLTGFRIELAEGGFIVHKNMSDYESNPDPVVFNDEDDMFEYISECVANKHPEKEDPSYSGKTTEASSREMDEEEED